MPVILIFNGMGRSISYLLHQFFSNLFDTFYSMQFLNILFFMCYSDSYCKAVLFIFPCMLSIPFFSFFIIIVFPYKRY